MFTKNKVSQSMIDAVKGIINESGTPIKEPTSTGMRVYGRSYGNSAKAKQDQTAHELDKVKGPKEKEMKEAAKPDFLDMDKDGNKKESMKKAIADKGGVKEELKGNQHKIDANHNDKIDAQDFKILKAKKKVTEDMYFAKRLLEAEKMKQSPAKNQDIADKSYLKDKPGVKSDLKNLGRFITGKKETNEEAELDEANNKKVPNLPIDNKGIDKHYGGSVVKMGAAAKAAGFSDARIRKTGLGYLNRKEEVEELEEVSLKTATSAYVKRVGKDETGADPKAAKTIQHIANRHGVVGVARAAKAADKEYGLNDPVHNKRKDFVKSVMSGVKEEVELTEEQLDEMINEVLGKDASAGDWIHDFVHSDNPKFAGKSKAERKKMALGAYYGKQNEAIEEGKRPETDDAPPFEQPYTRTAGEVKDKSGAVHTPMSRARDLARAAMKKVKTEMLGKTGTSEGKKW